MKVCRQSKAQTHLTGMLPHLKGRVGSKTKSTMVQAPLVVASNSTYKKQESELIVFLIFTVSNEGKTSSLPSKMERRHLSKLSLKN